MFVHNKSRNPVFTWDLSKNRDFCWDFFVFKKRIRKLVPTCGLARQVNVGEEDAQIPQTVSLSNLDVLIKGIPYYP